MLIRAYNYFNRNVSQTLSFQTKYGTASITSVTLDTVSNTTQKFNVIGNNIAYFTWNITEATPTGLFDETGNYTSGAISPSSGTQTNTNNVTILATPGFTPGNGDGITASSRCKP